MSIDPNGVSFSPDPKPAPISPKLQAIRNARVAVAERISAANAKRAAEDAAAIEAREELALKREQLEADVVEHDLTAERVYLDACLVHGEDRVAIVRTRYGSIVLRAQTVPEIDAQEKRATGHRQAAKVAKTPAEAELAERNATAAMELGLAGSVLTDAKHFERVTSQNPGLWPALWRARNALIDASVTAEGKAGAR